jgi:hypothetical protein
MVKPIVRYRTRTFTFMGETHRIKTKLTLLLRFDGPMAKKLRDISNNGKALWSYWDIVGKERLEVYEEEEIEDKVVKANSRT